MKVLEQGDPQIGKIMREEIGRQKYGLELIPSENFASPAVLAALGSVMTNKYSEGYPHKRYYGGNQFIDQAEDLAIERAKQLFGAEHVNVQPYSGSPANVAVYVALLDFGDTILGMNLAHGGHLTHGHKVSFSGKAYRAVQYGVHPETHLIDYDELRKLARQEKPKIIVSGATAYPREIDFQAFHEIAQEVSAISMADIAHIAGLIVGGLHQSPFPFTDVVTTTTHKTLRGPRGAIIMCKEPFAKDIDRAVFPGLQGGPHDHVTAAKAVTFHEASQPAFKEYAAQIVKNAKALAKELLTHEFTLISGGTDNHLILVDLINKEITGKEAEEALDRANITCNKNMIPFDPRTPFNPSGIRLGTPALTSRGMKEEQMQQVGQFIAEVIHNRADESIYEKVKGRVRDLCEAFPLYPDL
ncbi:serine hydroxymethyltransferase [Candidatus Zixiibacteriota bacterium]